MITVSPVMPHLSKTKREIVVYALTAPTAPMTNASHVLPTAINVPPHQVVFNVPLTMYLMEVSVT
jgi:hypothetical protein